MIKITEKYLTKCMYTRPGTIRNDTMGVAIHYFGKPKQTAKGCWDYWENDIPMLNTKVPGTNKYASAQFIIGLEGEILQTMPMDEMAYHVGSSTIDPVSKRIYTDLARERFGKYAENPTVLSPNQVVIGIECAHVDVNGNMTQATLDSLSWLVVRLLNDYGIANHDVYLHKDIVGWKDCHKYFVDNPLAWEKFKESL